MTIPLLIALFLVIAVTCYVSGLTPHYPKAQSSVRDADRLVG